MAPTIHHTINLMSIQGSKQGPRGLDAKDTLALTIATLWWVTSQLAHFGTLANLESDDLVVLQGSW